MINVVLCPTPRGGHIEHAVNLAEALARGTHLTTSIITRPGAIAYLGDSLPPHVEINERIRPLAPNGRLVTVRRLWSALRENIDVYRMLRAGQEIHVLVSEEPRYPIIGMISANRTVLFAHNAKHHSDGRRWSPGTLKNLLQRFIFRIVDHIVTHGETQSARLRKMTTTPVTDVSLPSAGWLEGRAVDLDVDFEGTPDEYLLCIGEIRWNKGFDLAAAAAIERNVRLVVAGAVIDDDQDVILRSLSGVGSCVRYEPGFIAPERFQALIRRCHAVVMPYREFHAQSGVLVQAVRHQKPVLCSDLPSLVEQTTEIAQCRTFACEDFEDLGQKMVEIAALCGTGIENSTVGDWREVADAVAGDTFRKTF
jgi:glycosyltransferase involved in cell wall biosynthesis